MSDPIDETVNAIIKHTNKTGVPPSMRELADILGMSVGGAHDRVRNAVEAGRIVQIGPRKWLAVVE